MDKMTVSAEIRTTTGKKAAKDLRVTGKLPAVMYNSKGEATMLQVNESDFTKVWKQATPTTLINLVVGKDTYVAFIKETEYDIITDKNLHVDFHVIDEKQLLTRTIKVLLSGNAAGVREGGLLAKGTPAIKIQCLPKDLPARVVVDVTPLKVGDVLKVKDIDLGAGVKILSNPETVAAQVKAPKK